MQDLVARLIAATNAFDVDTALALFAPDAVIDDVSVGDKFIGAAGVRRYIEQFFVGYSTATTMLSLDVVGTDRVIARVDFVGDFGHEIGGLDISIGADGRITRIDAELF